MATYDFGGPQSGAIQMAYTVPDIRAAMRDWIDNRKVGPWFYLPEIEGIEPLYRGAPTKAKQAIAMAFAGSMLIELIQPLDDEASIFKEVIDRRGHGFHHVGVATHDLDGDVARHEALGHKVAFTVGVPTGGRVAYIDTGEDFFVELIEMVGPTEAIFTSFYRPSVGWDGSEPIRSFG